MAGTTGWKIAGESGSIQQAIVLPLCLGLFSLLFGSVQFLSDRNHALHDIFLGVPAIVSAILTSFGLLFFFTLRGVRQRVMAGQRPERFFFSMIGGFLVSGLTIITSYSYGNHRLAADLQRRGVPTQARLLRTFVESCGKTGCSSGIEYDFTPTGSQHPVKGTANEGDIRRDRNSEYDYIAATGTVPILYDPENPGRSMVYWRDDIHRQASWNVMVFEVCLFGSILLISLIGLSLPLWTAMRALINAYRPSPTEPEGDASEVASAGQNDRQR